MSLSDTIDVEAVPAYELRDKFLPGASIPCHVGPSLDKPPEWLDREKFTRGQAFCRKYLASVFASLFGTNLLGLAWNATFQVFLYQGKTDTIEKQWKRQTRMFRYISKWFEEDIWDTSSGANRTMRSVHLLHQRSGLDTERHVEEVRAAQVDTTKEPQEWAKSHLWSAIRKDATLPENNSGLPPLIAPDDRCFLSQLDIAISVISILTPLVSRPRTVGVHKASREDLEGLLHLWRVIGYYVGLEDRFNPCAGTLEDFQTLCKEVTHGIIFPGFSVMTRENEYYARVCARSLSRISALFFSCLDVFFLLAANCLGMSVKNTYSAVSFRNKFFYGLCIFFFTILMRFALVVRISNHFVRKYVGGTTN